MVSVCLYVCVRKWEFCLCSADMKSCSLVLCLSVSPAITAAFSAMCRCLVLTELHVFVLAVIAMRGVACLSVLHTRSCQHSLEAYAGYGKQNVDTFFPFEPMSLVQGGDGLQYSKG